MLTRKNQLETALGSFRIQLDLIDVTCEELDSIIFSLQAMRFAIEKKSVQNFIEDEQDKALSLSTSTI